MATDPDSVTESESAMLLENGEIQVVITAGDKDCIGHGGFNIKPTDPAYADYKARFNLVNAGDWKLIERSFVDGKWVELPPRPDIDLSLTDPTEGKLI